MGFDTKQLHDAVDRHGRVVRVVIAGLRGSSPREVGASMLVWQDGQDGTIGGGALEYAAARAARGQSRGAVVTRHALGPELGQCCGGAVTLLSEVFDRRTLPDLRDQPFARRADGGEEMPLSVRRVLSRARAQGLDPAPQLLDGWMIEPQHRARRKVWIWGAGHVGRALVGVMAPLPDLAINWVDTGADRFPAKICDGVTPVPAKDPAHLVPHAPAGAEHLILTYSHELDLELCNRLLSHEFAFAGLIGSATKWARFRSRLASLGHTPERISRITCPIGDPGLGKHPQAIAVGVVTALLGRTEAETQNRERRA